MERNYSASEAQRIIRAIVMSPSGTVVLPTHAEQMANERGIDPADVVHVLKAGAISDPPELSARGQWRYRKRARGLVVVVEIEEEQERLVVVTTFWERS